MTFETIVAFREKPNEEAGDAAQQELRDDTLPDENDKWLICRQCSQRIAKPGAGISINGAHRHTFANPSGIVFEIGCFSQAVGCSAYGKPSTEFAWFAGFSWQIALCLKCLTHLGWLFASGSSVRFVGLILDRLEEASLRDGQT